MDKLIDEFIERWDDIIMPVGLDRISEYRAALKKLIEDATAELKERKVG